VTIRTPHNPDRPGATHTKMVKAEGCHVRVEVVDIGESLDYTPVKWQSARKSNGRWCKKFDDDLASAAVEAARRRVEREGLY